MFRGYIKKSDFDKIPLKKSHEDFLHFSYTTPSLDQRANAQHVYPQLPVTSFRQMEGGAYEGWNQPSEIVRPQEQEYEQGYDGGSQHSIAGAMNNQCVGSMAGYGDSQMGAYESASAGYSGMQTATGYDQSTGGYEQPAGAYPQSEYDTSSYAAADGMGGGFTGTDGDLSGYHSSNEQENVGVQQDPNPVVVRKKFPGPCTKYVQKICVRYLQPPQLPPPGPLIIKEIREPQPPAQPPLCIKQRMPPPATPPLLVLRERPPQRPPVEASKVICKRIPPPPPPKRQVIIERFPKPMAKPRDILIERWLPYKPPEKRKVIYQRAPPARVHNSPKNLVIMYEGCTQVERVFRKLGVQQANPDEYLQQYGNELLDASELENRAKTAGVREDLTPPALGQQHHQYALDSSMGAVGDSAFAGSYGGFEGPGFQSGGGFYQQGFDQGSQSFLDSGYGAPGIGHQQYGQEQGLYGTNASEHYGSAAYGGTGVSDQYGPAGFGAEAGISSQLPSGC